MTKPLDKGKVAFYILITYLSFLNIFVIKSTPEVILIQFLVIVLLYTKFKAKRFLKDWLLFIAAFVGYEFIRGVADDVSPFYDTVLYWVYAWEKALFGVLPTITLQKHFLDSKLILNVALFFYSSFFYFSFLVAFLIWQFRYAFFRDYVKRFILLTYVGLVFYFLIPTAPPWFVQAQRDIGVQRPLYSETIYSQFTGVTLYGYLVYGNRVAAMPSMHTGWVAFTSIYLISRFGKKYLLALIVPSMVGFSVVLTGEHYLLDVVAGFLFAAGAVYAPEKLFNFSFLGQKVYSLLRYKREPLS